MMVTCSSCQSKIRVPDSAAGKKGKCPKCGTIIAIPMEESPSEPEAAAPPSGGNPFDFEEAPEGPKKRKARAAADEEVEADEEDAAGEDRPSRKTKAKAEESIGLSLTSLILGIVSLLSGCGGFFCCCVSPVPLLCGIGALVTGFLGMKKGGKVLAIVGMSLGGLSILLGLGNIVTGFVGTGFRAFLSMVGAG